MKVCDSFIPMREINNGKSQIKGRDEKTLDMFKTVTQFRRQETTAEKIILSLVKELEFLKEKSWDVSYLISFSNNNFVLSSGNKKFIVRIPRYDSNFFSERRSEYDNSKKAHEQGYNPANILFFEEDSGVSVVPFLEDARFLNKEDFHNPQLIKDVAIFLKKLHSSSLSFHNTFNHFARLKITEKIIERANTTLPFELAKLYYYFLQMEEKLNTQYFESVPCHNDAIYPNFAVTPDGVKMIDWEVSGKGDPFWDLSILGAICQLSEEQKEKLLVAYNPKDIQLARYKIVFFTTLFHIQSCLWAFSKIVTQDFIIPEADFRKIYDEQLKIAKALVETQQFRECIQILTKK